MKYFIFSELNRNHFLFLSFFIISITKEIINNYITQTEDIIQTFNKYYVYSLSDFLSIIPLIIIKIRSKGKSEKKTLEKANTTIIKIGLNQNLTEDKNLEESKLNNDNIYLDNKQNNKRRLKRIIKLSILVSILDFLAAYVNVTFNIIIKTSNFKIKKVKVNFYILINILSKYALSILILHSPIYKHHYLSLAIDLFVLIVLIIIDILGIEDIKSIFFVLLKIIVITLYSFEDVYAKILLSIDSFSPYIYLFYRGICVNILSFLYSLVFIFVELPDEKGNKSIVFTRFWKVYENRLNILLYILLSFNEYLVNLNLFLIIDKFSPIHYAVASILDNFGSLLISIFYKEIKVGEFFIKLAIYFILILAALVYNEFIVLNFCGFQKNTQLNLLKLADIEQTKINNNENESLTEDESTNKNEAINIEEKLNNESSEQNLVEN